MTDRPIIFSAPMVRTLLDGRKSQTRRLLKLAGRRPDYIGPKGCTGDPACWGWDNGDGGYILADRDPSDKFAASWHDFAASYSVGDRLWVKHPADVFPVYFKPIDFGDGKYAAGTDGNIYRRFNSDWVKCAPRLSHNGYEEISLRFGGEHRPFRVSRLVAEAFYGPAPDGWVCRHMDGSRRNNQPENLDWGTAAQNSADAVAAGSFSGERGSMARLSAEQVAEIRSANRPQADLAAEYGVTQPTISKIRNGKRWGAVRDAPQRNLTEWALWRSPIFCPRWASRLTLIVTDVRIQRLHDISAADAIAEGCHVYASSATIDCDTPDPRQEYRRLWNSLHGPDAWAANPWVAALTFTVHRQNIDQMEPIND